MMANEHKPSLTKDARGRDILACAGPSGTKYLHPENVYIRASDGRVFVSGAALGGLDEHQAEMVKLLDRVKRVGNVRVGGE